MSVVKFRSGAAPPLPLLELLSCPFEWLRCRQDLSVIAEIGRDSCIGTNRAAAEG